MFHTLKQICSRRGKTEKNTKQKSFKSLEDSNLKAGDVIFVRSGGVISRLIRLITWSKWSHVAVYLGDGWVIDTDLLRRVSIHRLKEFEYWEAKRYLCMKDWHIHNIVSFLVARLGADYDWRQIWGFFVENVFSLSNDWNDPEKYSCGKIIDLAYLSAEIDLVSEMGPGDVTPEDLYRSVLLHDVKPQN